MTNRPTAFRTIARRSVVKDIIENFRQGLIRGELHPGQRLPSEVELTEKMGVGRAAVREAMKMLEALGVVEVRQGDGTFIVDKTSPTLLSPLVFAILLETGMSVELLELRGLIQAGYCQLASQHATEQDWKHIEEAASAWSDYARQPSRDVDKLTRLDLAFHHAILDATHNPLVSKLGGTIEELFFASIRNTLSQMDGLEWGIEGHKRILEALRTGDRGRIHEAVMNSLAYWGKEVRL